MISKMNDQRYIAALDVGGTKAYAAVVRIDGTIVDSCIAPGITPLDTDINECERSYLSLLRRLFEHAGVAIDALYCSIATEEYFGTEVYDYLRAHLDTPILRVEGDGPCLISGMLGHHDGACMICGTGSSLYIRKGDDYHRLGGWGHLIDSCGSGYVLGRLAIQAAERAADHRGEATLLSEILEKKCGRPICDEFVTIYQKGRPYIASFATAVFEARRRGDAVARRIFNLCASELADVIWSAYEELGSGFSIVFNGGIFSHFPEYRDAVKALAPRDICVVYSDVPPVYGCVVEAMYDIGLACDASFKENFLHSYQEQSF